MRPFTILKNVCFVAVFLLLFGGLAGAQSTYKIHVSNITIPEEKESNWYGRPTAADFIVSWELYVLGATGEPQLIESTEIPEYRVILSQGDSTFVNRAALAEKMVTGVDTVRFAGKTVKPRYYFRVEGLRNGQVVAISDTAWAVAGKPVHDSNLLAQMDPDVDPTKRYYKFPLFFPLAEILDALFDLESAIYHNSTFFGRVSFTLVWWFFLTGMFIVIFRCGPRLYLARLFPFVNFNFFNSHLKKDLYYEKCMSPRLRFVVEAWKKVMLATNYKIRNSAAAGLKDVDQLCYEFFKNDGVHALEALKKIIEFDPLKDDRAELGESVKKYFGKDGKIADLTSQSLKIESRYDGVKLNWSDVEKELFNPNSRQFREYPTVKILLSGLENHITNGFHWQGTSQEVDRAIENRASSEIQNLQEESSVDWLWNVGALAPLLGLFGTITGISGVFEEIKLMGQSAAQINMVTRLSNGIFEALWTTIYGLVGGIILMICYYYFKNTLDWIYNRWQSLFVHVTERL